MSDGQQSQGHGRGCAYLGQAGILKTATIGRFLRGPAPPFAARPPRPAARSPRPAACGPRPQSRGPRPVARPPRPVAGVSWPVARGLRPGFESFGALGFAGFGVFNFCVVRLSGPRASGMWLLGLACWDFRVFGVLSFETLALRF